MIRHENVGRSSTQRGVRGYKVTSFIGGLAAINQTGEPFHLRDCDRYNLL